MFKKFALYIAAAIVIVFAGMQFDRPEKNISPNQGLHFSMLYPIPDSVEAILSVACYDCHSNSTRYPWYAEIQPIGKWINGHIQQGKRDLNFSEFGSYRPRRQFRKMEEVGEMVNENSMPLPSYRIMHKDAVLTEAQKTALFAWVKTTRDSMKAVFPPDSIKSRKR